MAHRGCVQGRTGDDRVYRGSVQWHTGDVQGMTVKTQGVTGEDRGFSYGQGFLEPVVIAFQYLNISLLWKIFRFSQFLHAILNTHLPCT